MPRAWRVANINLNLQRLYGLEVASGSLATLPRLREGPSSHPRTVSATRVGDKSSTPEKYTELFNGDIGTVAVSIHKGNRSPI